MYEFFDSFSEEDRDLLSNEEWMAVKAEIDFPDKQVEEKEVVEEKKAIKEDK